MKDNGQYHPGSTEKLDRSQLKDIYSRSIADTSNIGSQKRCYYSCSFELNEEIKTIHSWGANCKDANDCSPSSSHHSAAEAWILNVRCL